MKKLLISLMVCALAAPTMALTGNPLADGWAYQGHSLAQGTYVRHNLNAGFDMYTTMFTVSDSSAFDISGLTASAYDTYFEGSSRGDWITNARQWEAGHTVVGIGGIFRDDITVAEAGWTIGGDGVNTNITGLDKLRVTAKVGNSDNWSASTVAPPSGNGGGSTGSGILVYTSAHLHHNLGDGPDGNSWIIYEGQMMGLQKGVGSHIYNVDNADVARLIWSWDSDKNRPGSWQILININLADIEVGTTDNVIASVSNVNRHTDAIGVVPEPATLALLGLGAVGLLRKRK